MTTVFVTFTNPERANEFVRGYRSKGGPITASERAYSKLGQLVPGSDDREIGFLFDTIDNCDIYFPAGKQIRNRGLADSFMLKYGLKREEYEPQYEDRFWPRPVAPVIDPSSFGMVSHRVHYYPAKTVTKLDGSSCDINDLAPGSIYIDLDSKPTSANWISRFFRGCR